MTLVVWIWIVVAVLALLVFDRMQQRDLEFFVRLVVLGADRPLQVFEIQERLERNYEKTVTAAELQSACRRLAARGAISERYARP